MKQSAAVDKSINLLEPVRAAVQRRRPSWMSNASADRVAEKLSAALEALYDVRLRYTHARELANKRAGYAEDDV